MELLWIELNVIKIESGWKTPLMSPHEQYKSMKHNTVHKAVQAVCYLWGTCTGPDYILKAILGWRFQSPSLTIIGAYANG